MNEVNQSNYRKAAVRSVIFCAILSSAFVNAPAAMAASINMFHTSPDTVTVTGQFTGEDCYNLGKTLEGGVELSSRGGTPDGIINLDLTQAQISATLNGSPITGSRKLNIPLSTVNDIFLIAEPKLVLNKTDVVKLTVTGAKIKSPGEVGLEIGYGNPDPRGGVEMYCHWDSLGNGGQHLKVSVLYPSPKPSPTANKEVQVTSSPVASPQNSTSEQGIMPVSPKSAPSAGKNWWLAIVEFFRNLLN